MNSQKNKILILSTLTIQPFLHVFGTPVLKYTVEKFINNGWKIFLLYSFKPKFIDSFFERNMIVNYFHIPYSIKILNTKYIRFLFRPLFWLLVQTFFVIKGLKIIKENSINIIYSTDANSAVSAYILSKISGKPVVFRFLGSFISKRYKSFLNKLRFWNEILAYKLTPDLIIMTDDGTYGEEVIKYFNKSIQNLKFWKNGVCLKPQLLKKENAKKILNLQNKFILLTISRLDRWKRVDRAISVLPSLIKNIPNIVLLIVGDGSERENLLNLAKNLNCSDNIIFVGHVNSDKVWLYYSASDIFLSLYEISNVGNPLFEAMISGCAIITLDNGDTEKYIKNDITGIILKESDIALLPDKIIELYYNEKLRSNLGQEARKFAQMNFYTWEERLEMEIKEISKLLI